MQTRIFLDWKEPLVSSAVRRLFDRIGGENPADFGSFLILVPSAEAGRLLREAMTEYCSRSRGIVNLDIRMPRQLFIPENTASAAEVLAAWCGVLQSEELPDLSGLLQEEQISKLQQDASLAVSAAAMFQSCRENLAEDGLSLAQTSEKLRESSLPEQAERFEILEKLETLFLRRCPQDPVKNLLNAVAGAPQSGETRTVIVLHCPDLRGAAAQYLARVSCPVEYWIGAPEIEKKQFDLQGRACESWLDTPLDVKSEQIRIAPKAADQVHELERLRKIAGNTLRAAGVLDADVASAWQDKLAAEAGEKNPHVFFPAGKPLEIMPWTRLYTALLALREKRPDKEILSAILRHGYIADAGTLRAFDDLQQQYLLQNLDGFPARSAGTLLQEPVTTMHLWHQRLANAGSGILSEAWNILHEIADGPAAGRFPVQQAQAELPELEKLITEVERARMTEAESVAAVFHRLLRERKIQAVPAGTETLNAAGFLELGWYPDETVILAGVSDNAFGYRSESDLFLPEQTKKILGLMNINFRRAADAFRLQHLQHNRNVLFLLSRFSSRNDVLTPPAVLMQCGPEKLPARVLELFGSSLVLPETMKQEKEPALFIPTRAENTRKTISPTDFAAYLKCPFNFYLEKVLNRKKATDQSFELDALQNGSLLHEVLADSADIVRRNGSADEIYQEASRLLKQKFRRFGTPLPGLLDMRLAISDGNLEYFAKAQKAWEEKGWKLFRAENNPAECTVEGFTWDDFYCRVFPEAPQEAWRAQIRFKGRFDRMDRRTLDNGAEELCIIDYKTGSDAVSPSEKHWVKTTRTLPEYCRFTDPVSGKDFAWQDLQLPLYILMVRHLLQIPADTVRAAYFQLPTAYSDTEVCEFTELQNPKILLSAMRCADEIARKICGPRPVFWPPRDWKTLSEPYRKPAVSDFDVQNFYREEA